MVRPERAGPPEDPVPAAPRRRHGDDQRQPEPAAGQPRVLPHRRAARQVGAARLRVRRVPCRDRQRRDRAVRAGEGEVSGTRRAAVVALAVAAGVVALTAAPRAQGKREQLNGVWILAGNATIEMALTPEGEAARAKYNYL